MNKIPILVSLLCLTSPLPWSSSPLPPAAATQNLQRLWLWQFPFSRRLSPQISIHSVPSVHVASFGSWACNFCHEPSMANYPKLQIIPHSESPYFLFSFFVSSSCLGFTVYLFILFMVCFSSWNVSFMSQFCSAFYHHCLRLVWHAIRLLLNKWMSKC